MLCLPQLLFDFCFRIATFVPTFKMIKLLKKPYPFIFNAYSVLAPSVITFLIITLLTPFQFRDLGFLLRILAALGISSIVAISIVGTVIGLKKFFPSVLNEDQWTVGKEMVLSILIILFITAGIFISLLFFKEKVDSILELFLKTTTRTLAISVLPVLFLVLFEQYRHEKGKQKEAQTLTEQMLAKYSQPEHSTSTRPKISIIAENQKTALQVEPTKLIFVKSEGNYVEISFLENNQVKLELVRNSLKAIEEQLPSDIFYRCHKRYLINMEHIQKVDGNARNLVLTLENIEEKIPVSRAKTETLLQHFQKA